MKLNHRLKADAVCSEGINKKIYIHIYSIYTNNNSKINMQYNQKMTKKEQKARENSLYSLAQH